MTIAADQGAQLLDLIRTCPSTRTYTGQAVPREMLQQLVEIATCAPSPRNVQPWAFVVVDDKAMLTEISDALEHRAAEMATLAESTEDEALRGMYLGGTKIMRSLGRTLPAIVLVCQLPVEGFPVEFLHSAVYSAAQNFRVAARAFGLATAFTTIHTYAEPTVRRVLAIPDDVFIATTIPVGYSPSRFAPVKRKPVTDVLAWNGWARS
jgi:nitroreductase